ncbi:MAG: family 20 glycosylhydrolase [Clostridia bacterium]|nr:family 20 glycosylhydrolase [Clostridia bacterium]
MIFHPKRLIETEGSLVFCGQINALAHPCLNKNIIRDFWEEFAFESSTLNISECESFVFSFGNAKALEPRDCDYTINIESGGVCICAENEKNLIRGFMTFIDRFRAIDYDENIAIEVNCCQISDSALIENRMVHFCIFPETELWELQRFVRFCGALKYTHIVLEFWGMLKYDCLKELAWSHAFTKEQISPIIREANDLGVEIIPMFNQWGHASAGRVMHGKHVVLDQNPKLQTYFRDDGWCWDIRKPKVKELLRQIRNELIELCGEGKYFHIGCDEAFNFEFTTENMDMICEYINEISDEMLKKGRRAIVWGDMFLYNHPHYNPKNKYSCHAPSPEAEEYMLSHLSRGLVIGDWQYTAKEAPVETVSVFKKAGFDCLLCPWDRGRAERKAALATVYEESIMGFMHTTWHTLASTTGIPTVAFMAIGGFEKAAPAGKIHMEAAALLRKVMPIHGDYAKSGWSRIQIHPVTLD